MILQNDFYAIESSQIEEGKSTYAIHINPLHTIFEGHFPGNPVTPGVVQIEIVKELLSTTLKRSMKLTTMGTCKFLAILNPNEHPDVTVQMNISNDEMGNTKVSANIVSGEASFFKMNAVYEG